MDRICRIRKGSFIPQARENEEKPGSAGRLTGVPGFNFMPFMFFMVKLYWHFFVNFRAFRG